MLDLGIIFKVVLGDYMGLKKASGENINNFLSEKKDHWEQFEYQKRWFTDNKGQFINNTESFAMEEIIGKIFLGKCIDVGIGNGRLLSTYADNTNQIVGLDLSRNLLKQSSVIVKERNYTYISVEGDAMNLPFKDNSFDSCIFTRTLEHIPNREKAFEEISRVVKPEGDLIIMAYNRLCFYGLKKTFLRHWTKNYLRHSPRITIFGLTKMCKKHKIKIEKCIGAVLLQPELKKSDISKELAQFGYILEKLCIYFPFKYLAGRLVIHAKVMKLG